MTTHEKILNSAFEVFSIKGYAGGTTKEIAIKAKVSEVTLFRHFGSKEALFKEMLEYFCFTPHFKKLLPEVTPIELDKALLKIALTFLKTLKEKKPLIRILLSESGRYPESTKDVHLKVIAQMNELLIEFIKSKKYSLRTDNLSEIATFFWGMIFAHFISEEIMFSSEIDMNSAEEIFRTKIDIFLNGIKKTTEDI